MTELETEPGTLGDDDESDGLDGDGEPEQIDGADDEEARAPAQPSTEALLQKLSKEQARYAKAIERILGPDDTRHECAKCDGLGIVWGEPDADLELATAEDAEPCPKCNALGLVLTGSKQPGQETMPCTPCGGRGWINKPVQYAPPVTLAPTPAPDAQTLQGQWIPGVGFIPYGQADPLPGSGS